MNTSLERKALNAIKEQDMLDYGDGVIVGLSGGADSVALLHFLFGIKDEFNLRLMSVHVNHCLRGAESDSDEQFCVDLCTKLGVVIEVFKADVSELAAEKHISEEEAGRELRYHSFELAAQKYNTVKIAVAHNLNDQAETLLMRMFRGTGVAGLCGIAAVRGKIIRPFLDVTRLEIEEYCFEKNLSFVTDGTNLKNIYTRNKIRNNLLPQIEREYNGNVVYSLANTAKLIKDDNDYLDFLADEGFSRCYSDSGHIDISVLNDYPLALKRRIIRKACFMAGGLARDIGSVHIEKILELLDKQSGKRVSIANGVLVERSFNYIFFRKGIEPPLNFCYDLPENAFFNVKEINKYITVSPKLLDKTQNPSLSCVYTIRFDQESICGIQLRTRRPHDFFCVKKSITKKLKDFLIEKKIDGQTRRLLFYLADSDRIISVFNNDFTVNFIAGGFAAGFVGNNVISSNETDYLFVQFWESI